MTFDHRYYASPTMFSGDWANKDFTQEYKDSLYSRMKQLYENNIEPIIESERLAHEATRKELEELQDAIAMRARQRVTMENNSNEYHLTLSLIYPGQGLKDEILINAIKASKERTNE